MTAEPFVHEVRTRRPVLRAGTAACFGLLLWGAVAGSNPFILALPAMAGALGLYWLLANRSTGVRITETAFEVWYGERVQCWPLAEIATIEVQEWADTIDWRLHFAEGGTADLPPLALPPRPELAAAMARRNISLTSV